MGRWLGWAIALAWVTGGCGDPAPSGPAGGSAGESDGSTSAGTSGLADGGDTSASADGTGTDSAASAGSGAGDDACDGDWDTAGDESSATSGGSAEDTNAGMGGDIPIGATVFEVRQHQLDAGTLVELEDLVVTTPVAVLGPGSLVFVQAPGGGEYSGIAIEASTPLEVAIGARVRVVGRVQTLDGFTRIVVDGDVEEVVVDGTAPLPEPAVVELAALSDPLFDLEPLEGALIRVVTPEVIDATACPGEFALAAELRVDDLFLGALAPSPATGSTYAAIVGPLRYTLDGLEVAPRTLDDLIP